MFDWLHNPRADYVLCAYGIALTTLLVFALLSWRWVRTLDKKWIQIQRERRERRP